MKKLTFFFLLAIAVCVLASGCSETAPKRPKILGVTHAAFFTKDLDHSRRYFTEFLDYAEPVVMKNDKDEILFTIIKINDRQYIELFPEREENTNRMYHYAIETDDAEAMRKYLAYKGYKVPESTPVGRTGNKNFFLRDIPAAICEIVEFPADGMLAQRYGEDMPETRITGKMRHVGFMVPDLDAALAFYVDVLDFKEIWRGGPNPEKVRWVHLQVPEGDETIELMLYDKEPTWDRMGTMNHICLEVDDIFKTKEALDAREMPGGGRMPTDPAVGINKKRQINYYLIDGTRIEFMEKETIDGMPVPSSTGEPMRYVPQN